MKRLDGSWTLEFQGRLHPPRTAWRPVGLRLTASPWPHSFLCFSLLFSTRDWTLRPFTTEPHPCPLCFWFWDGVSTQAHLPTTRQPSHEPLSIYRQKYLSKLPETIFIGWLAHTRFWIFLPIIWMRMKFFRVEKIASFLTVNNHNLIFVKNVSFTRKENQPNMP